MGQVDGVKLLRSWCLGFQRFPKVGGRPGDEEKSGLEVVQRLKRELLETRGGEAG